MKSKGSTWGKWDLHVHTPLSVLQNDFTGGWDDYVKQLFSKALEKGVKGIGITDYFLPEGYFYLRENYLENESTLARLFKDSEIEQIQRLCIFPNIEFRLKRFVISNPMDVTKLNRKLNFHVLLSNELSRDQIENEFLGRITFESNGTTGGKPETYVVARTNLEKFGARLKSEHSDFASSSDIFVGMMNAAIDENEIIDILQSDKFKNRYMIGINADEDLSKVSWSGTGHAARKLLIKQSHFVFSSNTNTVDFCLGRKHKSVNAYRTEFGDLKPCLWGSDAHSQDRLLEPDLQRYTWIKAEPSFGGLKQVVYDPESRVCISETCPQKKSDYQTIEKVRFVDKRTNPEFDAEWIPLNKDLTTIIGGKSSGKSLLLYHIARTVNSDEVDRKVGLFNPQLYKELEKSAEFDFEVEWSDGEVCSLQKSNKSRPITFVPQLYINHLAENSGRSQLNELIEEIICQNQDFKKFLTEKEHLIVELNREISDSVDLLAQLRDSLKSLSKEIESIGVKRLIEEEVARLKALIVSLQERSGFSAEELEDLQKLSKRKDSIGRRMEVIQTNTEYIQKIESSVSRKFHLSVQSFLNDIYAEHLIPKGTAFVDRVLLSFKTEMESSVNRFSSEMQSKIARGARLVQHISAELKDLEGKLLPFTAKIKEQKQLTEARQKLTVEEGKLSSLNKLEAKRQSIIVQGKELSNSLLEKHKNLLDAYKQVASVVGSDTTQINEDIKVTAKVGFNRDKFEEFLRSFDRRGNLKNLLGDMLDETGTVRFDLESYNDHIAKIYERIRTANSGVTVKLGISDAEVAKRLFSDCFNIEYSVSLQGDDIFHMSPGKRGLVLLSLILHLSDSTHPILIDQPEDNLDNRTIYTQLNKFIRSRKVVRQIVMVTHNANLVVSADAETVIVANQSGQAIDHENKMHRFEYCSGGLENTFLRPTERGVLNRQGIREHICEVLEGGVIAFREREIKYGLRH